MNKMGDYTTVCECPKCKKALIVKKMVFRLCEQCNMVMLEETTPRVAQQTTIDSSAIYDARSKLISRVHVMQRKPKLFRW